MATEQDTKNWPELAIGLYDKLTGRDAEISYSFDNFELFMPSSTAEDASQARWKMNVATSYRLELRVDNVIVAVMGSRTRLSSRLGRLLQTHMH